MTIPILNLFSLYRYGCKAFLLCRRSCFHRWGKWEQIKKTFDFRRLKYRVRIDRRKDHCTMDDNLQVDKCLTENPF